MSPPQSRIQPLGDAAVIVVLGAAIDPATEAAVVGLTQAAAAARLPGVVDLVPSYVALTVHYDPFETDLPTVRERLRTLIESAPPALAVTHRTVVIPVRYDGPDLDAVSEATGLTRQEVARRHAAAEYRVVMLGFVPGFAYLAGLDPALVLPRRPSPRSRVPPGSVAIAGAQTGIYPAATPGGWHLIGSTDAVLFEASRRPPNLLAVGDRVRFAGQEA